MRPVPSEGGAPPARSDRRLAWRPLVGGAVTVLLLVPVAWSWHGSRVPAVHSVMDMGVADLGGGAAVAVLASGHGSHGAHGHHSGGPSVDDLTGPRDRPADVRAELVARQERFRLASGEEVDGYTLNGSSPGPVLRARQGDLVEVVLVNDDVRAGVTLHWHGVDVPNAEDGVAGVTQDTVPAGERHVYRFVAEDPGTYWYHSHSVSSKQVRGGLLGTLVVEPADGADADVVAPVHTYDGRRTVAGRTGEHRVAVPAGEVRRVRLVNTDDGPLRAWADGPFRVLAVDARDVVGPTTLEDRVLQLAAGGRYDVELTSPARLDVGGGTALVLAPDGVDVPAAEQPAERFDALTYGTPSPLPFDAARPDRDFDYDLGRRPGFLDGRPGFWWTVNGRLYPDVPMYVVAEGDVVRMTIRNDSGDVHPMHLHGHHAVVLSRDGVRASGAPWWVDSLNVEAGETYEIAFLADNPGIWMDHCHNLEHAADGLLAHLVYGGVSTPYEIGARVGDAVNAPE